MKTARHFLSVTAAVVMGLSPAFGADVVKHQREVVLSSLNISSDAVERLRLVERLPMLTQRVAAASCAMSAGISLEKNRQILKDSSRAFGTVIRTLKFGNPNLNINAVEENRRILNDIELVAEAWGYTKSAIYGRLAGRDDIENAQLISAHSGALLEMTSALASDFYGHYLHPFEIKQADAMALNIAARQARLTQQIAHEACNAMTSGDLAQLDPAFQKTVEMFDASLRAMRGGMASVGLQAAPTLEIEALLTARSESWKKIKAAYLSDNQKPLENAEAQQLLRDLDEELREIEHLVTHYAAYASRYH